MHPCLFCCSSRALGTMRRGGVAAHRFPAVIKHAAALRLAAGTYLVHTLGPECNALPPAHHTILHFCATQFVFHPHVLTYCLDAVHAPGPGCVARARCALIREAWRLLRGSRTA
jgi:hypothetical protein